MGRSSNTVLALTWRCRMPCPSFLQAHDSSSSSSIPLPDMPAWVAANSSLTWDCSLGADVAAAVRAAAKQQLGLTVSVGVAPNKLLAKLASRAAKPDGVHVVGGLAAVQTLLADTPVDRLPGGGGCWRCALVTDQHAANGPAVLLPSLPVEVLAGRSASTGYSSMYLC
jgi:nucleotidyltransferase/DNA polymerase involved in DNA repair